MAVLQDGPDPVSEIIAELRDCGAAVLFGVDATNIQKSLQACPGQLQKNAIADWQTCIITVSEMPAEMQQRNSTQNNMLL